MTTPKDGTRYGSFLGSAALTASDIVVEVYKNGSAVADTDLTALATGAARVNTTTSTVGTYQYSVNGLAVGTHLLEVVRSAGGNFNTVVNETVVGAPVAAQQQVLVVK